MQMLYMDIRTKAHSQCEFQKLGYILKVKSCLGRSKMCLVIGMRYAARHGICCYVFETCVIAQLLSLTGFRQFA